MRWIRWYFADDDVWCYYEVDDDWATRQVDLVGPDRAPATAAARSELDALADVRQVQAYEATYGVLAETALTPWPDPLPETIDRGEFDRVWAAARHQLEQRQDGAWRWQDGRQVYQPADEANWIELRTSLQVGENLSGTVVWIPRPGTIGIGVDLGLRVGGFVDVLLLPRDVERWPELQTRTDFEILALGSRPQIHLRPVDRPFLREDYEGWVSHHYPQDPA